MICSNTNGPIESPVADRSVRTSFSGSRRGGRHPWQNVPGLGTGPETISGLPLRRLGFTLVELLTVIAIVAVLASLLMTAIGSAKKKSRTMVSTFNLRQISLALNLYLDDFGKRPPAIDDLLGGKYLTESRSLLCPEDKTGNWGKLVQAGSMNSLSAPLAGPDSPAPVTFGSPIRYSYLLHPLSWDEWTWNRLMQEGGSAGVAACQLHGLGTQAIASVRSFEGLLLRAQRDSAVVRRHLFWNAPLPPDTSPTSAVGFNSFNGAASPDQFPFQIYLDAPPDWPQLGP